MYGPYQRVLLHQLEYIPKSYRVLYKIGVMDMYVRYLDILHNQVMVHSILNIPKKYILYYNLLSL